MSVLRDSARWLAAQLAAAREPLKQLSAPQLASSSIEAGTIEEYDVEGTLVSAIGEQFDGTHAAVTFAGPVPPEPEPPTLTACPGQVEVRASGNFVDGALSPMDLSHFAVHASRDDIFEPDSTTQKATIQGESGDAVTITLDPGEWSVLLVAVSLAGKWSDPSDPVQVEVPDDDILSQLLDTATEFDGTLTEVQISIDGKTAIRNATTGPTANGTTDGDRWQVWTTLAAGGKLTATWRWAADTATWIAEAIDPSYLPLIDIGAGTFGTLGGGRLSADAIDGKTVTGAILRTAVNGARVVMDSSGLNAYDAAGTNYFSLANGIAAMLGSFSTQGPVKDANNVTRTIKITLSQGKVAFLNVNNTGQVSASVYSEDGMNLNLKAGNDPNKAYTNGASPGHLLLHDNGALLESPLNVALSTGPMGAINITTPLVAMSEKLTVPTLNGLSQSTAVEANTQFTWLNSWTHFGGGYGNLQIRQIIPGVVLIQGMAKAGTKVDGTVIGVLDAAFRPNRIQNLPVLIRNTGNTSDPGLLSINPNGNVSLFSNAMANASYATISVTYFLTSP